MSSETLFELRSPPTDQAALDAAKAAPSGWVYDFDFQYHESDHVPPEAIRGAWEVSPTGTFTGKYRTNSSYRKIIKSNRSLPDYVRQSARHNPEMWISEIDPRGESLFPDIPDTLIVGWWYSDKSGQISGQFRPNSLYNKR